MKCQRCDQNEATVHEVTIAHGKPTEKHLCESCAQQAGISPRPAETSDAFISKFIIAPGLVNQAGPSAKSKPRSPACAECGMTWMDFRKSGLLGCASCYEMFESRLAPLIERAQEGATHHVGKVPQGSADLADHQRTLRSLRLDLAEAIEAEQYEQAAELRDSIAKVEDQIERERCESESRTHRGVINADDPESVTHSGAADDDPAEEAGDER